MNEYINKVSYLQRYIKKLHNLSGKLNLYISLCYKENNTDIKRLKIEIEKIKQSVANIENTIDSLELNGYR